MDQKNKSRNDTEKTKSDWLTEFSRPGCKVCDIERQRKAEGKSYHWICPKCELPIHDAEENITLHSDCSTPSRMETPPFDELDCDLPVDAEPDTNDKEAKEITTAAVDWSAEFKRTLIEIAGKNVIGADFDTVTRLVKTTNYLMTQSQYNPGLDFDARKEIYENATKLLRNH